MDGDSATLVKLGWLWYDDDAKSSLEDKVAHAAARYQARFGRPPRLCYVHSGALGEQPPACGRILVRSAGYVLPHNFLFVVDGEAGEALVRG